MPRGRAQTLESAAMRADMHTHSNASDGTSPPAEVMRRAAAAGLDLIALTDHDTVAGHAEAAAALPPGLSLVPGMEMSTLRDGTSVHVLAYLFDPAEPELAAECAAIRSARVDRARATVDRLAALGAPVTWEQVTAIAGRGVVGRPHIARALTEAGVVTSPDQAFTPEWIGSGGRAYVGRYAPDPVRAVALISGAGGVAVLAHPLAEARGRYGTDELITELAGAGLAGLEVDHPSHEPDDREHLRELAGRLGLIASGGSDDHGELTGHRLGCDTIAPENYQQLVSRATGAEPVRG
jgi:predicted metal-dependent phosphoesterase TrpH